MKTTFIFLGVLLALGVSTTVLAQSAEFQSAPNAAGSLQGKLRLGVMAIGGESTGVVLQLDDGTSVELDLQNAITRGVDPENGDRVHVTGHLTQKIGVEIHLRHIFVVDTIEKL